jgi:hypothetical protein
MLMDDRCSFECPSPTAAGRKAETADKTCNTTALNIGTKSVEGTRRSLPSQNKATDFVDTTSSKIDNPVCQFLRRDEHSKCASAEVAVARKSTMLLLAFLEDEAAPDTEFKLTILMSSDATL